MQHRHAALVLTSMLSLIPLGRTALSQAQPGKFFEDGAKIVWLGDSITHACLFTRYLEDYALTRYPSRKLQFVNCGVSGDKAMDTLLRFDSDVAIWKPNRVLVCLGMNDAGFSSWNQSYFDGYTRYMGHLLRRIGEIGATPILMTPPPIDQISELFKNSGILVPKLPPDYDQVLTRYGEWLEDTARTKRLGFIDLLGPMQAMRKRLKFVNPGATLNPDGIHPGVRGSALVALTALEQLGERGPRFRVVISKFDAQAKGADAPQDIAWETDRLRFTMRARSLPWVLPLEARSATLLSPIYSELASSTLRLPGLAPGDWELLVNDSPLLIRSARQWSKGVDIGLEEAHADWKQSLQITELNGKRNRMIRQGIREIWEARRLARIHEDKGEKDRPSYKKLQAQIAHLREGLEEMGRRVLAADEQLRTLNRPKPRRYELRRVTRR